MDVNVSSTQSDRIVLMDITDAQESMLTFLGLIMSTKSKEEQQKEALEYLKSKQNLLMSIFKLIANTSTKRTNDARSTICDTCTQMENLPNLLISQDPCDTQSGEIFHLLSPEKSSENSLSNHFKKSRDTSILNKPASLESYSLAENNCNREEESSEVLIPSETDTSYQGDSGIQADRDPTLHVNYPKRRRKSKYYNFDGDLSHIRREPNSNSRRGNKDTPLPRMKIKRKSKTDNNETIRLLARKMIDVLTGNTSMKDKEHVLALLRADESLREVFRQEKVRVGKKKVPIVRDIFTDDKMQSTCSLTINSIGLENKCYESLKQNQQSEVQQMLNKSNYSIQSNEITRDVTDNLPTIITSDSKSFHYRVATEQSLNELPCKQVHIRLPVSDNMNINQSQIQNVSELERESDTLLTNLSESLDMACGNDDFRTRENEFENDITLEVNHSSTFDEAFREHFQSLTKYTHPL